MKPAEIAAAAALAGAAAVGIYMATGRMPDAKGDTCTVSTALGPCEAAKALGADADDCRPGSMVYRRIEQRFAEDGGLVGGAFPSGVTPVPNSTREVPCASLRRPEKALTARKPNDSACVVGEYATDAGMRVGRCCEPGCRCVGRCVPTVPMVISGHDPTEQELCEAVPETCADGGP